MLVTGLQALFLIGLRKERRSLQCSTIALETITGVAKISHRDNGSYRFGLLFVWPRPGLYTVFTLRRMHAAISRAAGVGGTSARVSSEISRGEIVSRTGMTTKSGYRFPCSRRKRPGNVQTKPRDCTISNADR